MNLEELEERAREALPIGVYDYFAGGADDEVTLADSTAAWRRLRFLPHVLRDVTSVDTTTTILGHPVAAPLGVAPTAFQRLAHDDGECAVASGSAAAGALQVLSARSTATPVECATAAPDAPRWYQAYVLKDRDRTAELVVAARDAGCDALALTADTPFVGRRLRDARNRFVLPADVLGASLQMADGERLDYSNQDPALTFADIGWLREITGLPVVVKGVLRADDARACVDAGAAAVWVSNHGGRQLDGAVASADALPAVVAAVGDRVEIYVDGGIRSGADILRALALGARAAFVGRPVLWGLATDGAKGVEAVLRGLSRELSAAMALAGVPDVAAIAPDLVAR